MTLLTAHQKQFVLGPSPVSIRADWISIRLAQRLVLSHCPKLRVARLKSRDGVEFYLLGLAVLADTANKSVSEMFSEKDSSEIEEWTGFWAGKWALISAKCCWQDASGCLGLYYRHAGDDVWISSAPALLAEFLPNLPSLPRIPWQVTHRLGIDWIPAPLTTREDVYKALPQRTVDPVTGAMLPVRFSAAKNRSVIADQGLVDALTTLMANWAALEAREHLIGLTAGLDTRTILGAACAAKIDVATFTTSYPDADPRDIALAPRVAASVGVPHSPFGEPESPLDPCEIKAREVAIAEHMDGATFHPVSASLARGFEDLLNDSGQMMAGGHVFGLARCYNWNRFARAGFRKDLPTADQLLDVFFTRGPEPHLRWRPEPRPYWKRAMQLWLDSLKDDVPLELDWRDRFQLEQRVGAWNSGLERVMDLVDGTYFYPGNCLWVFHLLLLDPPEKRIVGSVQKRAIQLMAPALAKFPVNPPPTSARIKKVVGTLLPTGITRKLKSVRAMLKRGRAPATNG